MYNLLFAIWKIQVFAVTLWLVCAQNTFQRNVDETFGDLLVVTGIADDILSMATRITLVTMIKTFMLFFSVFMRPAFALTWTSVNSDALEFPSWTIS